MTKTAHNEKRLLDLKPMPSHRQEAAEKAIQLQTLFYYRKERVILREGPRARRVELGAAEIKSQEAGLGSNQGAGNVCQESLKNRCESTSVASFFTHFQWQYLC